LLSAFGTTPEDRPAVLWSLQYTQLGVLHEDGIGESITLEIQNTLVNSVISLLPPSLDLAIDNSLIDEVRTVWKKIIGDDEAHAQDFLVFEDRAGAVFNDDGDDNGDDV
jgi:Rab proteins geranylgeranyltransferase component A